MWRNWLSSVLGPSIRRGFQSWLDAWSTNSKSGFILQFFFIFPIFWWNSMHKAHWIEISVEAFCTKGGSKDHWALEAPTPTLGSFCISFYILPTFWWISMCVAQWTKLSVGTLGNEGIPKLARCLKQSSNTRLILHFSFHFPNILMNLYVCGSLDWAQYRGLW